MPPVKIRSILLEPKQDAGRAKSGEVRVRISLADGSETSVLAATPEQASVWIQEGGAGYSFGKPALYVQRIDDSYIEEGARALTSDLGGYWLRYYNSLGRGPTQPTQSCSVASVALAALEPSGNRTPHSAVVELKLKDNRLFSLLSATPAWFQNALEDSGLRFYFGPCPLFLREMDPKIARAVVDAMAAHGDRWLCAYDTPRKTLSDVLAEFKTRHA